MAVKAVPPWAQLPPQAPESHRQAWERAWNRALGGPRPGSSAPASINTRIAAMLTALVDDPESPTDLVSQAVSAHMTEGRGAPDGPGPRGRLMLACLRRDCWRTSWVPASLAALQETEYDLTPAERRDLAVALLSRGRVDEELRPLVAVVAVLGRPGRDVSGYAQLLREVLASPDVDAACRERVGQLLRRPGWFVARRENLKDHPELDEATRSSLRRSREVRLMIPGAVAQAVGELAAAGPTDREAPRRLDPARRRGPKAADLG